MSLFKKSNNTQITELLFNLENKIDILDNKFESIKFMDGCCECQSREQKIYTDLKEYLNTKLLDIKNSLLDTINQNLTDNTKSSTDLETKLTSAIEEIYVKNKHELLETLQKCCETHTNNNKVDVFNLLNSLGQNLTNILSQIQKDLKSNIHEKDLSLRNDLQTFFVGIQKDLTTNTNTQTNNYINHLFDVNNQLTKHIKDLESLTLNIDKNVNNFYYENEIIKHQLQLSEEIRRYSDEIEHLRELATTTKQSIDYILQHF